MRRVLLPVDGSLNAARAVAFVRECAVDVPALEVHLVNVQPLADEWIVHRLLPEAELAAMAQEYGAAALAPAEADLGSADVRVTSHIERGEVAPVIARLAQALQCDQIIMGTRGLSTLGELLMGSVATKVLHLATVPVTFVK